MMSEDRIQLLLIDRADCLRTPGFTTPRDSSIVDDAAEIYKKPSFEPSSTPTDSSKSSAGSSQGEGSHTFSSQSSSGSTAPSTAPSIIGPQQLLHAGVVLNPISTNPTPHSDDILCCEFVSVGCTARFHRDSYNDYLSHSISHFRNLPPPTKSACIFCDDEFFENIDNPIAAWQDRMRHISNHLEEPLRRFESARPDYFVLDYMGENTLLSAEAYVSLKNYTERTRTQRCPGLLPAGERPEKMKRREERETRQLHDLDKERRLMKKIKNGRASERP